MADSRTSEAADQEGSAAPGGGKKPKNRSAKAQAPAESAEGRAAGPERKGGAGGPLGKNAGQNSADVKGKHQGADNAGSGPKKMGLVLKLILIFVPILLVAAFVAEELIFDYLHSREFVGGLLIAAGAKLDPQYKSVEDELRSRNEDRVAKLDERESGLNEREAGIAESETELTDRGYELDARETELDGKEATLQTRSDQLDKRAAQLNTLADELKNAQDPTVPVYLRDMTDQELADMTAVSTTYSRMDPAVAASILAEMRDPNDVAAILYYMNGRSSAAILAAMEPGYAARLTEILISG